MTKLQTSLSKEETWVDGATEKLQSLPTAKSALELDVSTNVVFVKIIFTQIEQIFTKSHSPIISIFSFHLI